MVICMNYIQQKNMLQTPAVIDEEDLRPPSPFRSFLDQQELNFETPLLSQAFRRESDGKLTRLEIYLDRVVDSDEESPSYFMLENEIYFGFRTENKRIWFENKQNGGRESYLATSENQLRQFIAQLRKRCPQTKFEDSYEFIQRKGKGTKSCVFLVKSKLDGNQYATKIQSYTSNLKQQLQILQQLQHPNLIYFRQYFIEENNKVYIVMDYEDGGSLLDLVALKQCLGSKDKMKIFTDMLNALEYLRIKGIVHRDLKPENILYSKKDGNYKIADFGLSKKQGDKLDKIAGTPGYIAPELLTKLQPRFADIKSDIYSMGLIFYEILTMEQYYSGNTSEQILKKNMEKISLKKKKQSGYEINSMEFTLLQKMIRSEPGKRKTSIQILKSPLFSKINKLYGLEYLSSTSPSKKYDSDEESNQKNKEKQNEKDDGLVYSFWKLLRIRSWSG